MPGRRGPSAQSRPIIFLEGQQISARDRETIRRLVKRLGREKLCNYVMSLPPTKPRPPGAPAQSKARQEFLVMLYRTGHWNSIRSFAKDVNEVFDIEYSRPSRPLKRLKAIEKDLKRGLEAIEAGEARNLISREKNAQMLLGFLNEVASNAIPHFAIGASSLQIHVRVKDHDKLRSWLSRAAQKIVRQ